MTLSMLRSYQKENAFTLIELVIVFSIMVILSTIGIASFVSYSHAQEIQTTMQDMKSMLVTARSRALSQLKEGTCATSNLYLQGYEALFCYGLGGASSPCYQPSQQTGQGDYTPNPDYELVIVCSTDSSGSNLTYEVVSSKKFPSKNLSYSAGYTTATSFFFQSITGAVTTNASSNPWQVGITGYSMTKVASVSATGVVQ